MKKKKILLSGGSGFIGRNILINLQKEYSIYAIENNNKILSDKNIKKIKYKNYKVLYNKVKSINFDAIIHSATYFNRDDNLKKIDKIINCNIELGCFLLELSKNKKIKKFIYFASNWENDDGKKDNPKNFYAATKLAFSKILKYYKKNITHCKYYSLYLPNTFGYNDYRDKIIPTIKKNFVSKKKTNLKNKNISLNLINVLDIVNLINILLIKKIPPGEYSLNNPKYINITKLLKQLASKDKGCIYSDSKNKFNEKIYKFKKIPKFKLNFSDGDSLLNYIYDKKKI